MVQYDCDDRDVEAALRKLEGQVTAAGGWCNDQAGVRARGGGLTVFSSLPAAEGATLFALPTSTLLPMKKIRASLQGDDLVIESHDDDVPKPKLEMMDTMLEIYNLQKKVAFHRATSPWLAFANDPESLKWIASGRPDSPYAKEVKTKGAFADIAKLTTDTFLHTRYLHFKGPNPVLMPFVDFANHHPAALGYMSQAPQFEGPGIALMNSKPLAGSDECFAQYQMFDSMDMFVIYGYVEKNTPFVRSVPVIIKLHGLGTIRAQAFQGAGKKGKLPAKVADLRPFLPKVLKKEDDVLHISHFNIPNPEAPHALRRVLRGFIRAMKQDLTPEQVKGYVKEAEFHIITRNIKYYKNLMRFMNNRAREKPENQSYLMARELAVVQLDKLSKYRMLEQGQSIQRLLA